MNHDRQNLTILVLTLTAGLLAVLIVATHPTPQAQAGNTSVKQGDYIMAPGSVSRANDAVYILDVVAQQLNMYMANPNTDAIEPITAVNLKQVFSEP